MKRSLNLLLALIVAALFAGTLACGDSDDDDNTTTDITTTDDTTTPEGDVTEPEGDVTEPEGDVTEPEGDVTEPEDNVEPPAGACMNEADGPLLDTPEKRDAVTAAATQCGLGCLDAEDVVICSAECVNEQTNVSVECSTCYAEMVLCSKDNCLGECLADPGSDACFTCQTEAGCYDAFYECSGMTPPAE